MEAIRKAVKRTFLYRIIKDMRATKALSRWDAQDQKMFEFYSGFVAAGDLCMDVGANVGNRTKIFLRLGATVVAVEPQERCLRILAKAFGKNPRLRLVRKALGEVESQAELHVSEVDTISSLSENWIDAVKKSGRFSELRWDKKQTVQLTTLDKLLVEHGMPAFIKIDVEGFEYQVIKGLSRPVRVLSLEFTPEFLEPALKCIDHLQRLGNVRTNYSLEENMALELDEWVSPAEVIRDLSRIGRDNKIFGDLYVRFETPPGKSKS